MLTFFASIVGKIQSPKVRIWNQLNRNKNHVVDGMDITQLLLFVLFVFAKDLMTVGNGCKRQVLGGQVPTT